MIWLLFALFSALFDSLKDVSSKRSLKHVDEYAVSWAFRFFATLFILPVLFFAGIPSIGSRFWEAMIIGGTLNIVTTVLYMKAYKHSDLSITSPITAFQPLFLLITAPVMLGEFPSTVGLMGVLLIVFGSYMLNIRQKQNGYLAPFRALFKEKGPRMMLAVAFIWSITSNFDKIGVQNSSPVFWTFAQSLFLAMGLLPLALYKSKQKFMQILPHFKKLAPIGLFSALTLVFQMTALGFALVAYVSSIKRTSSVISVIFGHFVFREKGVKERLAGAVIMVLGVLLIALS